MRVWGLGFAFGKVLDITRCIWKNNSRLSAKLSTLILLFSSLLTFCIAADSISGTDMQRLIGFMKKLFLGGGSSTESNDPIENHEFPCTMEEFGYRFNEYGEMRNIQTGEPFIFHERENDHSYNQQRYDALGELVTEHVYKILEDELKLKRVYIPESARKEDPQSFIFMSDGAMTTPDKLMLLIHGSGVVRAGQWSRKLIINESLDKGSQIPYIKRAFEEGFEVIVLNSNLNQVTVNGRQHDVKDNETPEDHGIYVWHNFVLKAKARNIAIVAHSYGGVVTFTLADMFLEEFKRRVFSIVFTDSVHAFKRNEWSAPVKQFMKERAVNFAASYVPINVALESADTDDCCSVSAGTEEHERTSYTSIAMAFKYIRENYQSWSKNGTMASHNFEPLPKDLSAFQPSNRWCKVEAAEAAELEEEREEKKESEEDSCKNDQEKPVTEGDKQVAEKSEPITEGDKQATKKSEPITEGNKQAGEKSEPITEGDKQAGEKSEPIIEGDKQAAEKSEPITEGDKHATKKSEPIIEGDKQAAEESEPITEGDKQAGEKSEPIIEGDKQAVEKSKPETQSGDGREGSDAAQMGKEIEMAEVGDSREITKGDALETETKLVKVGEAESRDATEALKRGMGDREAAETLKMKTDGVNTLEIETHRIEVMETMDKEILTEDISIRDEAEDLQSGELAQSLQANQGKMEDAFLSEEGQKQSEMSSPSNENAGETVEEKQASTAAMGTSTEGSRLASIKSEL